LSYIQFYRIQTNDAIILGERSKYLDPTAICETRHGGPSKCADNHDMLAGCKTSEEKNKKRMSYHKDVMKRVAVYIEVMMVNWQAVADTIYASHHIGYV
jgi:hypothetical protein